MRAPLVHVQFYFKKKCLSNERRHFFFVHYNVCTIFDCHRSSLKQIQIVCECAVITIWFDSIDWSKLIECAAKFTKWHGISRVCHWSLHTELFLNAQFTTLIHTYALALNTISAIFDESNWTFMQNYKIKRTFIVCLMFILLLDFFNFYIASWTIIL